MQSAAQWDSSIYAYSGSGAAYEFAAKKKAEEKRRKKTAAIIAVILICVLLAAAAAAFFIIKGRNTGGGNTQPDAQNTGSAVTAPTPSPTPTPAPELKLYCLDVGQADSTLILCGGMSMLVDGGNEADWDYVTAFLKSQGVDKLDIVICTHPHEDHAGGLAKMLDEIPAARAMSSVSESENHYFNNFLESLNRQGTTLEVPRAGDSFMLGGAKITVIGPVAADENPNNMSLALKIEFEGTSIIMLGDAEYEEEKSILENAAETGLDLECDVLKVPHHGSNGSSCYELLYTLMPKYALISVGANNSYGHPGEGTLSRLEDNYRSNVEMFFGGADYDSQMGIYRTDLQGVITLTVRPDGYEITTEK